MNRIFLALLLTGVLAAGGCGSSDTYTGPNGEKVTVSKDGKSIDVKSAGQGNGKIDISRGGQGVALPDDFPKDVPVYPGGTAISSIKSDDGMVVTLQTADAFDAVVDFYAKELKTQDWTTNSTLKLPTGTTYVNTKEKRNLSVSITGGDKTMIMLMIAAEKKNR
jgi:hypothetical protein